MALKCAVHSVPLPNGSVVQQIQGPIVGAVRESSPQVIVLSSGSATDPNVRGSVLRKSRVAPLGLLGRTFRFTKSTGERLDPHRTACEDWNLKFLQACRNYAVSACVSLDSDITMLLLKELLNK